MQGKGSRVSKAILNLFGQEIMGIFYGNSPNYAVKEGASSAARHKMALLR